MDERELRRRTVLAVHAANEIVDGLSFTHPVAYDHEIDHMAQPVHSVPCVASADLLAESIHPEQGRWLGSRLSVLSGHTAFIRGLYL